jgi:hypothetical protein
MTPPPLPNFISGQNPSTCRSLFFGGGLRFTAGHCSPTVTDHWPLSYMKTVNLKSDMPQVHEGLQRLDRELALARNEKAWLLKLVHGYGSTGAGGDIRIAVQKRLMELTQNGQIRGCIFGENWSKSDEATWKLLQSHSELKSDPDLGRRNQGITMVLL